MTAPGCSIAVVELGLGAIRVGVVAQGEDRASDTVEEFSCRLVLGPAAAGDVACSDQHRVVRLSLDYWQECGLTFRSKTTQGGPKRENKEPPINCLHLRLRASDDWWRMISKP